MLGEVLASTTPAVAAASSSHESRTGFADDSEMLVFRRAHTASSLLDQNGQGEEDVGGDEEKCSATALVGRPEAEESEVGVQSWSTIRPEPVPMASVHGCAASGHHAMELPPRTSATPDRRCISRCDCCVSSVKR